MKELYGRKCVVFEHDGPWLSLITVDDGKDHRDIKYPDQKGWDLHVKRLNRSNLPVVAVYTVFEEDSISIDGIASKTDLIAAMTSRKNL